jgi:hypothetical protein
VKALFRAGARAGAVGTLGGVVLLASAACSSFGATDAAVPGNENEAGVDGSAGDAVDGSVASACTHDFCASFDDMPFDAPFGSLYERNGAGDQVTILPVRDPGVSPFVRLTVPTVDSLYAKNYLKTELAASTTKLTLSLRVRVTKANTTTEGDLLFGALVWSAGGEQTTLDIGVAGSDVYGGLIQARSPADTDYTSASGRKSIADGLWHSVSIVVNVASAKNVVGEWYVDSTKIASTTFALAALPVAPVEIQIGVVNLGSGGAVDHFTETIVDLDDVTYDAD